MESCSGKGETRSVPERKGPVIMAIRCCYGCVAPKRHEGCWGHCPEYIQEKAKHDAQNEAIRKQNAISYGITVQKAAGVTRALKKRRHKDG